ncbi:MAG: putative Fe-S cluster assembly protein SufT [Burkholderiaceae bacterium]|nr:putative Fe-S cluster assembly protein SufT [Burkholderiaceae bacterium]ODS99539.1 MAG: putative Fe-S cluster assembly protein SufT [Lautropia sp. SCN 69-89]
MGYRHGDIQEVTLTRDCPAVAVPWGTATTLEAGRVGYISQQLGGTFTVMVDGNLYRIDGRHADALGLELDPSEELSLGVGNGPPTTVEAIEKAAWAQLGTCYDPEIPIDIVNLGLVYACEVKPVEGEKFRIDVRMTLTAAGCGMGTLLADEARTKLLGIPNVEDVDVELVWDPPWSREMMSESAQLEMGLL